MDHKTWLWRKRTSEKTIVASNTAELSSKENEEKAAHLENYIRNLNEELAAAVRDCNAKDDLVATHAKTAEEAIAGREKAEKEAAFLKKELDEALLLKVSANEKITQLNSDIVGYKEELSSVREDQEKGVHDAVTTSREFEKAHKKLEEKFKETSQMLADLMFANSHLKMVLLSKDNVTEDLIRCKSQAEAEFDTLMARLDSTEKENAFLKYEFRMLEKELEIRNDEMESNRRSADASHKQHVESMKKVSKLEAECQRLRVLLRKRLPGPAALATMRSEVEMHGRNHTDMRGRNRNPQTGGLLVRESTLEKPSESWGKNANFLVERMSIVEEENKILKEFLAQRDDELHSSRASFARTTSRLSQAEAQLKDLLRDPKLAKLVMSNHSADEMSLTSSFDIGYNSEIFRFGSWSSALIKEGEHLRHDSTKSPSECKSIGVSDMSLMDDFVEMEKLAIVAVDSQLGSSNVSSNMSDASSNCLMKNSCEHHLEITGKELVLMEAQLETRDVNNVWLQDVVKVILDQNRGSNKSLEELLDEVRVALCSASRTSSKLSEQSELLPVSGYITWKTPTRTPRMDCLKKMSDIGIFVDDHALRNELKTMKASQEDPEVMLQLSNGKSDLIMKQLHESEERIGSLQSELQTLKDSKRIIDNQLEQQKLINEDLDTQLTVSKLKLNEAFQKLSSLEVELEERSQCCEELEATCLELGLQLESVTNKDLPEESINQEQKLLQSGWEITVASEKLAECQETIFNLGKQLKALSSRREAADMDKDVSTKNTFEHNVKLNQRLSLRDQMLADGVEPLNMESPKKKAIVTPAETHRASNFHSVNHKVQIASKRFDQKHAVMTPVIGSMAIVPSKQHIGGSSLLRKLFRKRKKGNKKTRSFSCST